MRTKLLLIGLALLLSAGPPSDAVAADVARFLPAIVEIRAKSPNGTGVGSGFLIDPQGIVVTCFHVVDGASELALRLHSGETYSDIRVVAFDRSRDLALLKFAGYGLPTIPLGDSEATRVGDTVIAIGHPNGLDDTVTKGIISSLRTVDGVKVLQTDAAASPGNSGGPLLNEKGECVGVISFKAAGEALNFAIPINYVKGLLGMQHSMSLAEMATASRTDATALFTSATTATGKWRSLESNTIRVLRADGDYITGEVFTRDETQSLANYDLKKQPDGTYAGRVSGPWSCRYWCQWACFEARWVENSCHLDNGVVLTKLEANRIEGYILGPKAPDANDKSFPEFCKTCGVGLPKIKQPFVWVRME
jgi:hypothetical protein